MYFKYTSLCKGELIKKYYEIVGLLSSEAFKKKKAFIKAAWYAYVAPISKIKIDMSGFLNNYTRCSEGWKLTSTYGALQK